MLIELDDDLSVETDNVTAVRRSTLDDDQCVVFCVGQSAVDGGFLVNLPYDEVTKMLREARYMAIAADLEAEEKLIDIGPPQR